MITNQAVIYVPPLANGDSNHPTCKRGIITAISGQSAFVLFTGDSRAIATPLARLHPAAPTIQEKLR